MYKVIEHFRDMQDNYFEYNPGDSFPRKGLEVSEARIKELSTKENRKGRPMIEPDNAKYFPNEPKKAEIPEDFMNKPEISEDAPVEEKPKPRRGRKKKDA